MNKIINFCKEGILKTNEFISGVHFLSDVVSKKNFNIEKIAKKSRSVYKKNGITKIGYLIKNFLKKNL